MRRHLLLARYAAADARVLKPFGLKRTVCSLITSRWVLAASCPQLRPTHDGNIDIKSVRHFSLSVDRSNQSDKLERDPIITDEGIVLHQSDPSKSNGHGLVWGSVLWPSGVSLSKYLVNRHSNPARKETPTRILELGCGTGIVGLTLAKILPQSQVTLTDSETTLWPLLRKNISANFSEMRLNEERVSIHGLDWRDTSTFLPPAEFDLIVASDVLYSGMDKLFARALASHLSVSSNEALIACPFRKDSPLAGFFGACHRLGLELERLEDGRGRAVGAHFGVDPKHAFSDSRFVPINESDWDHIVDSPLFVPGNQRDVQIFRIRRVQGTPEQALHIRRASRI